MCKTICLDQMRYVQNRITAVLVRAEQAKATHVGIVPDPNDNWLGWRLVAGKEGVPINGASTMDDILDALQINGWVRIE